MTDLAFSQPTVEPLSVLTPAPADGRRVPCRILSVGTGATARSNPPHHNEPAPVARGGWTWASDANLFFGYNYQQRKFADFSAWESQNWFMLEGSRQLGTGRLDVVGMASLEPFRIPAAGSPQLFQTGESYQLVPLVNAQHPHDLLMGLGVTYRIARSRVTYIVGADLVGSPALGPTAFMHRSSARDNP